MDIGWKVRAFLAGNENTPSYVLDALSEDKNVDACITIAKNKKTSSLSLEKLAKHPSRYVKMAVSNNKNSSETVLKILTGFGLKN